MSKLIVECCANSVKSAVNGQLGGAKRIELCANLDVGGITPSKESIILAREVIEVDLYVLIRPRGGDFVYSNFELKEILRDITFCKEVGCEGIVIGALNNKGGVNKKQIFEMMDCAGSMEVTFHRAFDKSRDYQKALEDIIECGCDRLLTSGQAAKAIDGIEVIKKIKQQAESRIELMVGSGVNASNASEFYSIGIRQFHMSGVDPINLETSVYNIKELVNELQNLA